MNALLSQELQRLMAYCISEKVGAGARGPLTLFSCRAVCGAVAGIEDAGKTVQDVVRVERPIVMPLHSLILIPLSKTTSPIPLIVGNSFSMGLKNRILRPSLQMPPYDESVTEKEHIQSVPRERPGAKKSVTVPMILTSAF